MSNKKSFLYAALLFFSGAILGAVCLHVVMRFRMAHGFDRDPAAMVRMIMHHLDRELDLTDEQHNRLEPIVTEMQQKFQELRKEIRPRMDVILDDATHKAERELSPPQRDKLHELENRVKERFTKGPPGPGN